MPRMRSAGAARAPRSIDRSQVELQELDQPILRMSSETIVRRDRAGRTVWLSEYSQTGTGWSRTEARIENGRAEIAHRTRSERWTTGIPLAPEVRFDGGRGLLRIWDRRTMPRLEFREFNLGAMTVDRVVIEAAPGAVPDADGRIAVLRKRYEGSSLRAVARLLLDRDNRIVEVTQPSFGTSITIRPSRPRDGAEAAVALQHAAQRPVALALSDPGQCAAGAHPLSLRLSGRPRFRSAANRRAARDGRRGERARRRHRRHLRDLRPRPCRGRGRAGPGAAPDPLAAKRSSAHPGDRGDLRPVGRLRDAEDGAARGAARKGSCRGSSSAAIIRRSKRWCARAGDCTEAAVLLAALGRAAGIPTRVVSGLVYSRDAYHGIGNVFMPHSWVLAYVDGEWKSFDSALDRFDSTHIALVVGDGDARSIEAANQLASLLEWQSMTEVRARPGSLTAGHSRGSLVCRALASPSS